MKHGFDLVVIGGGFYGVCIALYLKKYFSSIAIVEATDDLLTQASYNNQARIHNGYHYPRSPLTALRSHVNFQRFLRDYPEAVDRSFKKLYGIAQQNSKVTARQFYNFMKQIGSPIQEKVLSDYEFLNPELLEAAFEVEEVAFNATILRKILKKKLSEAGIKVFYNSKVTEVREAANQLELALNSEKTLTAHSVFNCTYADLNTLLQQMELPLLPLKHELTEIALVSVPPVLKNLGVTIMDGPFFSVMPFPDRNLHSFSHVRYTPHKSWSVAEPSDNLGTLPTSKFLFMQKDAARYLPMLNQIQYQGSLFAVKTILAANEHDDGRPILFRKDYGGLKNFYVVMGGKIDNIYDIFEKIDQVF